MAQRSNFQIDDIKINKRGNAFFMDIDAALDEPNQICKLNISDVELCNDGTLECDERTVFLVADDPTSPYVIQSEANSYAELCSTSEHLLCPRRTQA